ncbi:uncharacterized protein LOC135333641 isoform X3 [Halichondria panicea]|uniref:uncharacterized protein LOC135333641 isoform X3 n=1 Tax=Halichondria panicea TaxID=6063 RepID=UPI00312B3C49
MATSHDLGDQLYEASEGGHVNVVEKLLAREAPLNWRNIGYYGRTALHAACLNNKPDVVKVLTQQDDINVQVQDTILKLTPLHYACWVGHLKCVQLLMATGQCDLGAVTSDGLTPLGTAVRWGHLGIIKYLIKEYNVNVNVSDSPLELTPLGEAVRWGHLDIIKYIIMEYNMDVKGAVTSDGLTVLGVAVRKGHLNIIKFLVTECDVDFNDSAQAVRILELTLKDNGDVATKINENNQLLLACKFGYTTLVRYLINKCNVDVDRAVTMNGLTPLGMAVKWGHLNTIKYLISDCNVDVNGVVTSDRLTLLEVAAREGHLDTIKHLILECNVDVKDGLLLIACKYQHTKIVEYLLNDVSCDPNVKDDDRQTPLSLAWNKDIIQLLLQHGATAGDVYTNHRKALGKVFSKNPLKNPVKMLVIGHGGEGKSTLIEAMEHEPTALTSLVNIFVSPKEVDGVSQKTAGIIPRLFKSSIFGEVLVCDFAGQEAYYSSHAAIIKSAVYACRPIIVLVLGLHRDDTLTTYSISYWLGIIANRCANIEGTVPLIVVGSHVDCLTDKQKIKILKKEEIVLQAVSRYPTLDLLKFIPMDNRYSNSSGMKILRNTVGPACARIRSKLAVSLNAHMFLIYLVRKDEIAVSLEQVQRQIKEESSQVLSKKHKEAVPFIPTTIPRLVEICFQLNDKGHILFLHNTVSPEMSFIVLKKQELLGEVNGTIFAPEDFDQHCQLSTSTGVVPCSKLAAHFSNLDTDMLTGFLIHLEFAVPIEDPEVLRLIDQHRKNVGESVTLDEKYFFCPALIRLDVRTTIFKHRDDLAYHFGWVMSCSHKDQFLDARFLHVLLLRISLSLGLAPVIDPDIPSLQHQCSVWKTGVCWGTADGVKVLVEVVNKKKAVVLIQAHHLSLDLFKLRSIVIKKVVDTSIELCSTVVTEEALLPPDSVTYPLEDTHVFDLKSIAESIVGQKMCVVSTNGVDPMPLSELLQAEVYADLGENILQALCNPAHDKKLSDGLLSALSSCWSKNPKLSDIVRSAVSSDIKSTHRISGSLEHVLRASITGDSSGEALRRILDPLSVFAGRNPLELAGVAAKETSDYLLPAPRPIANCPSTVQLEMYRKMFTCVHGVTY